MINTTTHCRCGGEKAETHQWCDGCWEALPGGSRESFISLMVVLQAQITACDRALEIDKKPEDQPSL